MELLVVFARRFFQKSISIFTVYLLFGSIVAHADVRDYYTEPGLHPFKSDINQSINEHIDPFGGTLRLTHTDLHLSGNGGLDISINRTYTNLQAGDVGNFSPYGVGWQIHFGRTLHPIVGEGGNFIPCGGGADLTTRNNPSFEFPDGRREMFFRDNVRSYTNPNATDMVSKSGWRLSCDLVNNTWLIYVTSPDGVKYTMNHLGNTPFTGDYSWYATRIEDLHGNFINVSYVNTGNLTYIDYVESGVPGASNYRYVDFQYTGSGNDTLLSQIVVNGRAWRYQFRHIENTISPYYYLTRVIRPDSPSTSWIYEYYPWGNTQPLHRGSLRYVIYPNGGRIDYTYQQFDFDPVTPFTSTTAIQSKTISGPGVQSQTWTYNFQVRSDFDVTTVTTSDAIYQYYHYGVSQAIQNDPLFPGGTYWRVGSLRSLEIYDRSDNNRLLQRTTYTWIPIRMSAQWYWHGRLSGFTDYDSNIAVLSDKIIERDSETYTTTYQNHDEFGNPRQIVETGNLAGDQTRITDLVYQHDTINWIIGRVTNKTVSGTQTGDTGTITRTYTPKGQLDIETKYGVATNYDYDPQGNISLVTDAEQNQVSYLNYKHGIPQTENHPENVTVTRIINNDGTITRETNGRSRTTSYLYDGLYRVRQITPPINAQSTVAYTGSTRTLTRGNYRQVVTYDGFGRAIRTDTTDTTTGEVITTRITRDYLGRELFVSFPNSVTDGTNYSYDAIGRVKTITNNDNSTARYNYGPGNQVAITDERGNVTTYLYRAYGDPEDKQLVFIRSPESIATKLEKNVFGQVTAISQGQYCGNMCVSNPQTRVYQYDARKYLTDITNPETGLTHYTHDNLGNIETSRVGISGVTIMTYDGKSRLKTVDYPTTTQNPDVEFVYDENDNIKNVISYTNNSVRQFNYDDNDNLTTETLSLDGRTFALGYGFNNLDVLETVTYPKGRVVNYDPDAFGRATQVGGFVSNIQYHPTGQPESIQYANGAVSTTTLTNRNWTDVIQTTSPGVGTVTGFNYDYDPKGNPQQITDLVNNNYNLSNIIYDNVDRLTNVTGLWGAGSITYDYRGNIRTKNIGSYQLTYNYNATTDRLDSTTGRFNHSFSYDNYGNISAYGGKTFSYDDASNLRTVTGTGINSQFTYDGSNNLIKTYKAGVTKYPFYQNGGEIFGEYDGSGNLLKEYIYLGRKLIALVDEVPAAPPTITVGTPIGSDYTISWGSSIGITHYELLQSDNPQCEGGSTITVPATQTSYNVTNQTNGTYYYCVRACNNDACGDYTLSGSQCAVIGASSAPCIPAGISVPAVDNDRVVTINWQPSADGTVTAYELQQATTSNYSNATTIHASTNLTHTIAPLANGTYYYRVRACNAGNCSPYVNASNALVEQGPVAPGIPGSITAPASNNTGDYTVSWTASTGTVTFYELQESTKADFTGASTIYTGNTLSKAVTGKIDGVYYYRVRACNGPYDCSGYRAVSTPITVTGSPYLAVLIVIINSILLN